MQGRPSTDVTAWSSRCGAASSCIRCPRRKTGAPGPEVVAACGSGSRSGAGGSAAARSPALCCFL
eukprot:9479496-Pyramimonas_sp.AAC.1